MDQSCEPHWSGQPGMLHGSVQFSSVAQLCLNLCDPMNLSSAYLRLLVFLLAILIPACASSSPAFLMMYSAYKLNKQSDNIQP